MPEMRSLPRRGRQEVLTGSQGRQGLPPHLNLRGLPAPTGTRTIQEVAQCGVAVASAGKTHSTAVKGRSSTRMRVGFAFPPSCGMKHPAVSSPASTSCYSRHTIMET